MRTHVEGHWSHDRNGKRIWVHGHEMNTNPRIHRRHEHRLEEKIKILEEQRE